MLHKILIRLYWIHSKYKDQVKIFKQYPRNFHTTSTLHIRRLHVSRKCCFVPFRSQRQQWPRQTSKSFSQMPRTASGQYYRLFASFFMSWRICAPTVVPSSRSGPKEWLVDLLFIQYSPYYFWVFRRRHNLLRWCASM